MSDRERERRAASRAAWPITACRLSEQNDDLSRVTTAAQRVAMMWQLALEAWSIAGHPMPQYERGDSPGRVIRAVDEHVAAQ